MTSQDSLCGTVCRLLFLSLAILFLLCSSIVQAAESKDRYDIIYLLSPHLEKVLDYQQQLASIFDAEVEKKLKVMAKGDDYALIYDGNDSARSVTKTLIEHAAILSKSGFDEPYATKEQDFEPLYNVSYGIGPNLEPLKKKYAVLYKTLGEKVGQDLFIEKTDYGNYKLIYRRRGEKKETTVVARRHAKILKRKRISVSVTKENNNEVVFGESSLINEEAEEVVVAAVPKPEQKQEKATLKAPQKTKREIAAAPPESKPRSKQEYLNVEQSIEDYINGLRKKGRISRDESTGWMVYDLAKDQPIVDINANREFQAASMIKPFVALAFFHKVKEGKFKYGPKSRRQMEAMIQRSSNPATNWVMRQAGGPKSTNDLLRRHYGHIFKKTEIKEYIPPGGRTYLNSAPPADYIRFLRALWKGELPYNKEIRRLMALPGRDRIYNGTPIPRGTLVYNKTGSTAHLCGDMGILVARTTQGGRYPYAIVGIIERRSRPSDYGRWMHSRGGVIREVSTLVYKEMKRWHKLR
jgi:beta-lactamase class A